MNWQVIGATAAAAAVLVTVMLAVSDSHQASRDRMQSRMDAGFNQSKERMDGIVTVIVDHNNRLSRVEGHLYSRPAPGSYRAAQEEGLR